MPVNLLILGGTGFVGRHIAYAALRAGHHVTVFNRGHSPDDLPVGVERLRGDRDTGAAGLASLTGRTWDACVDVSGYTPAQVRPSAETLHGQVGRYVFVSSRAVYAEPCPLPIAEDTPLQPPAPEDVTEINAETYGPLKVICERIVRGVYGEAATLLRPQIIVGPHDPEPRYPYWVERAARGGVMLAPGDGSAHLQVIDVRDVARFVVTVVENAVPGVFNLAGPRLTWAEFLRLSGAEEVRWVPVERLRNLGVNAREFSLYVPGDAADAGRMNVSAARALAAGLTLTDPAVTVRDTREWSQRAGLPYSLIPEFEADLLSRV